VVDVANMVRQRAGVEIAAADRAPARVRISIGARGHEFSGRLEMDRPGGAYVRELVGASCEETASALAFVLAQALLPEGPPGEAVETPQALGPVERTRTVIPPTVFDRPPAAPRPEATHIAWWAGVHAGVRKAPIPIWAPMFGGFVDWRVPEPSGFAPSLGVGFVLSVPTSVSTSEWSADVAWVAGRLSMCPTRLKFGLRLAVVPCIGGHAGAVWASGAPLTGRGQGASSASPWFDAFAELRVDVEPTDSVSVRLGVEAIAIISRYDLTFDNPKTLVFQMPNATLAGSLGVALRAW
jgi:hypothetical protein